jgi:hypothetical protein
LRRATFLVPAAFVPARPAIVVTTGPSALIPALRTTIVAVAAFEGGAVAAILALFRWTIAMALMVGPLLAARCFCARILRRLSVRGGGSLGWRLMPLPVLTGPAVTAFGAMPFPALVVATLIVTALGPLMTPGTPDILELLLQSFR